MKDLIIIGAGPAGLSAAIYGKRAGLDLLVIEKLSPGGQVMTTYEVENYPGFKDPVSGFDLISAMEGQALRFGTEIINADIISFEKQSDDTFIVKGSGDETYQAKSLILAMGSSYRKLGVPGETEFTGMGVSYCATCDAAFYRNKITAVVGGGNTALEEALFLTRFASKVYIVHRRDTFRADKVIQERLLSNDKIECIFDAVVEKVNGTKKVESMTVKYLTTNKVADVSIDGFFIFIGYDPLTKIVPRELCDEYGQVIVDMHMRTSMKGVFAAGDLRIESQHQIVNACADGATAALSAYEFLSR
jgi:thioredoxin reductase (NADPH)